jgi:hypothetical protein
MLPTRENQPRRDEAFVVQRARRSNRPAKQLMWLWFAEDMSVSRRYADGLDVACGEMLLRRFFQTKTYTGLDFDADRLAKGLQENPDVRGVVGPIQNLSLTGDLVVCMQTIGFNKKFDRTAAIQAVDRLVAATRSGGALIFNVRDLSRRELSDIGEKLRQSFGSVDARPYGSFVTYRYFRPRFVMPVVKVIKAIPMLRGRRAVYYRCIDRR